MRKLFHIVLIGLVVTALLQVPAIAAPAGSVTLPIGVILQADRAMVGNGGAASGAAIFDGDRLQTHGSGSLQVRLGASQAYLLPSSSAVFHQAVRGFSADLIGGTVVLSAAQGETFLLQANGAEIRPGAAQPTVAQVTVVNSNELLLTSRRGVLEVSAEGEVRSLPEGSSYRMLIQPPDPQGPQGTQASGRSNRTLMWILVGGAVAGTSIAIWRALVSADAP